MRFKSQIGVICCLILICGIFVSGCDQTSAQRVESVKAIVNQAVSVSSTIDASIADIEKVIASCEAALADPNIPEDLKSKVQLALTTAQSKLEVLTVKKKQVSDILDSYGRILSSVDYNNLNWENELELYSRGAAAIAPLLPEKTRGYIYLATILIPLAGGLIASVIKNLKQSGQISDDKAVLTDIVISVDKLLGSDQVKDIEEAKFLLQDNQSGFTQDTVDAIHDPMQNTAPAS